MIPEQIDKYQVIKRLGGGNFGDVYLAHDLALDTTKVIKVIKNQKDSDGKSIFKKLEEAQILYKCQHKNIVYVNEANIFEVDGKPSVIIDMEYLPDGDFESAIKNHQVSIHQSIRYVIDCLFALENAHFNGVLHRDIKPANIMLCGMSAKLSDFGLATILGEQSFGSPKGYTLHLPPEYFTSRKTTVLTDIFATGITLYRACNYIGGWNELNSQGLDIGNIVRSSTLIQSVGFAPFIPLKLKRIINQACALNPEERYQSASEFRRMLERLRPNIDWLLVNEHNFKGVCVKTRNEFVILLEETRLGYDVELKRNNRRQTEICRRFENLNSAEKYLYNYVSSTLFN